MDHFYWPKVDHLSWPLTQRYKNRMLAIMTAFSLVAAIAGRRYNISGEGLNIYVTVLMRSGMGKDSIENFISAVLSNMGMMASSYDEIFHGPRNFTGQKAISNVLLKKRCFVSVLGEAGFVFSSEAGDSAGKRRIILQSYTRSGQDKWLKGESYSSKDDTIPSIQAPCMSLVFESTPEVLLKAYQKMDVERTGELARNFVLRLDGNKPYESKSVFHLNSDLRKRIAELCAFCSETNDVDDPQAKELKRSEKSHEFSRHCVDKENEYKDTNPLKSIMYSRANLKRLKIEGLMLALEDKDEWDEAYEWSVIFHEYEMESLQFLYKGFSESVPEQVMNVVGEAIVKILNNGYKSRKAQVEKKLRDKGIVTHSTLSQALKNNSTVQEWDDPGARGSVKSGLIKMIDVMISNGLLIKLDEKLLKSMGMRAKLAYQITSDFKIMYEL